jgi:hypothetical protein
VQSVFISLLHSLRSGHEPRCTWKSLRFDTSPPPWIDRAAHAFASVDDRILWAWLPQAWRSWRPALQIIKPETVIAWHRRGFRLFWTWKSRRRTGRPGVAVDVRASIRELSTANPLWGAPRIHGELQKLGISVSQSTVAKYMRRHPRPPSQTWRTFLRNHASQIVAADLFIVPTVTFRLLFVLVVLAHDRRRIVHVAVTEHPAAWTGTATSHRLSGERRARICIAFIATRCSPTLRPPSDALGIVLLATTDQFNDKPAAAVSEALAYTHRIKYEYARAYHTEIV